MNTTFYIFGEFNNGYNQYPDNYTSDLFHNFYKNANAPTQLAIHRNGELMYYGYIRKYGQDKYIGLCVVINGCYLTTPESLFPLFENTLSNLISAGDFLHFSDSGDIVSDINKLYVKSDEIDVLNQTMSGAFDSLLSSIRKLPPVSYATANNSVKNFVAGDPAEEISKSTVTNSFTYIYKSKGYNTAKLNSYASILKKRSEEIHKLTGENNSLKSEISSLKAQQRNLKWVAVLGAVCLILFFIVYNKVINPAEVTKYPTPEFVYYGPLEDHKPHGTGVAIYPKDDEYGRVYYYGNFDHGDRYGDHASLLYNDGSYFYGQMNGDHWVDGIQINFNTKEVYEGTFDDDNQPYSGKWYEFREVQEIFQGRVWH